MQTSRCTNLDLSAHILLTPVISQAVLRTFQGLVQVERVDHDAARRAAAQGRAGFAY